VILDEERWAELRRFRGLHESGAMSISAIARETGLHRQTVRKYLAGDARPGPPRGSSRKGTRTPVIAAMAPVIAAMAPAPLRRHPHQRPQLPAEEPTRRHHRHRHRHRRLTPGHISSYPPGHITGYADNTQSSARRNTRQLNMRSCQSRNPRSGDTSSPPTGVH
jgi:hypothetical protein